MASLDAFDDAYRGPAAGWKKVLLDDILVVAPLPPRLPPDTNIPSRCSLLATAHNTFGRPSAFRASNRLKEAFGGKMAPARLTGITRIEALHNVSLRYLLSSAAQEAPIDPRRLSWRHFEEPRCRFFAAAHGPRTVATARHSVDQRKTLECIHFSVQCHLVGSLRSPPPQAQRASLLDPIGILFCALLREYK